MNALTLIAQAAQMYGGGAMSIKGGDGSEVNIPMPPLGVTDWVPIVAIVAVFGSFLLAVLAIILFFAFLTRRQDRLITYAIQQNQPEIARELLAKRGGFWRAILWIILFIAALAALVTHPFFVFVCAALLVVYLTMGPDKRATVLGRAADATGNVQGWLAGKARETARVEGPAPYEPPRTPDRPGPVPPEPPR
jgi:hypothetical protein